MLKCRREYPFGFSFYLGAEYMDVLVTATILICSNIPVHTIISKYYVSTRVRSYLHKYLFFFFILFLIFYPPRNRISSFPTHHVRI